MQISMEYLDRVLRFAYRNRCRERQEQTATEALGQEAAEDADGLKREQARLVAALTEAQRKLNHTEVDAVGDGVQASQQDKGDGNASVTGPAVGSGMTWQDAKASAELIVKRDGWPGFNQLVLAVGCSKGTLYKAVEKSSCLRARKAEYEDAKATGREVGLNAVVLTDTAQSTEGDPLANLIAQQKADETRDHRQSRKVKNRLG